MKKKGLIIASLLVLVMSVVFLGCPPPDDDGGEVVVPGVLDEANGYLTAMGSTFVITAPGDGTYTGVGVNSKTNPQRVTVAWEDVSLAKYNAYKTSLPDASNINIARAAFESDLAKYVGVGAGFDGIVDYVTTQETVDGLVIKANSAAIKIWKLASSN